MNRKIIHIDCDCFYAAVEMRDDPSLRHRPIAVGGDPGRRGVISTCNYEAREYGVRSAMASAHARRLCPELIILPVYGALPSEIVSNGGYLVAQADADGNWATSVPVSFTNGTYTVQMQEFADSGLTSALNNASVVQSFTVAQGAADMALVRVCCVFSWGGLHKKRRRGITRRRAQCVPARREEEHRVWCAPPPAGRAWRRAGPSAGVREEGPAPPAAGARGAPCVRRV